MNTKPFYLLLLAVLAIGCVDSQNSDELLFPDEVDNRFPSEHSESDGDTEGSSNTVSETSTETLKNGHDGMTPTSSNAIQILCPNECVCQKELNNYIADCSGRGFTDFPSPIDIRTTILKLQDNNLAAIPQEVSKLKDLQFLNANNNEISKLEPGSVSELPELLTLKLANNRISEYPKDLENGLNKLELLDLDGNENIKMESSTNFLNLKSLRTLILPKVSSQIKFKLCTSLKETLVTVNTKSCHEEKETQEVFNTPDTLFNSETKETSDTPPVQREPNEPNPSTEQITDGNTEELGTTSQSKDISIAHQNLEKPDTASIWKTTENPNTTIISEANTSSDTKHSPSHLTPSSEISDIQSNTETKGTFDFTQVPLAIEISSPSTETKEIDDQMIVHDPLGNDSSINDMSNSDTETKSIASVDSVASELIGTNETPDHTLAPDGSETDKKETTIRVSETFEITPSTIKSVSDITQLPEISKATIKPEMTITLDPIANETPDHTLALDGSETDKKETTIRVAETLEITPSTIKAVSDITQLPEISKATIKPEITVTLNPKANETPDHTLAPDRSETDKKETTIRVSETLEIAPSTIKAVSDITQLPEISKAIIKPEITESLNPKVQEAFSESPPVSDESVKLFHSGKIEIPSLPSNTLSSSEPIETVTRAVQFPLPNVPQDEIAVGNIRNETQQESNTSAVDVKIGATTDIKTSGGVDKSIIAVIVAGMVIIVAVITIKKNWSSIKKRFSSTPRSNDRSDRNANGMSPEEVPLQDKSPV